MEIGIFKKILFRVFSGEIEGRKRASHAAIYVPNSIGTVPISGDGNRDSPYFQKRPILLDIPDGLEALGVFLGDGLRSLDGHGLEGFLEGRQPLLQLFRRLGL